MFEQTIGTGGEKRPWTFLVSVSGQTLVAAAFVALPLFYTEQIGARTPPPPPMVFLRAMTPEPLPARAAATSSAATPNVFRPVVDFALRAPAAIPDGTLTLDEPAPMLANTTSTQGIRFADARDGVLHGMPSVTTPPPTIPKEHVVEKPPAPRGPVSVGGDVQAAKLIKKVVPEYPALARNVRVSGTVRLMGIIAKDGTIQKLELLSGHPLLTGAALNAVRQWVYRPTLLNGIPVEVQAPIDVIFTLSQ